MCLSILTRNGWEGHLFVSITRLQDGKFYDSWTGVEIAIEHSVEDVFTFVSRRRRGRIAIKGHKQFVADVGVVAATIPNKRATAVFRLRQPAGGLPDVNGWLMVESGYLELIQGNLTDSLSRKSKLTRMYTPVVDIGEPSVDEEGFIKGAKTVTLEPRGLSPVYFAVKYKLRRATVKGLPAIEVSSKLHTQHVSFFNSFTTKVYKLGMHVHTEGNFEFEVTLRTRSLITLPIIAHESDLQLWSFYTNHAIVTRFYIPSEELARKMGFDIPLRYNILYETIERYAK